MSQQPDGGNDDSLDFSHLSQGGTPPSAPQSGAPRKRQPKTGPKAKPAAQPGARRRNIAIPVLLVGGIAVAVALNVTDRGSGENATSAPARTPAQAPGPPAPGSSQAPPPSTRPAQTPAPAAKKPPETATQASKPAAVNAPAALPDAFLKEFRDYESRTGAKAIALALDGDGRFAYAAVAGLTKQPDANEEALSDCARYRAQSGIRSSCRLYAIGNEVVWQHGAAAQN